MRKLKEDDQVIVYEYIPQDKIEKGKGEITVNKLDSKVIDYKLSKVENEKCDLDCLKNHERIPEITYNFKSDERQNPYTSYNFYAAER
ncbi:hypothetical protein [Staphylococcus aureus]|uniref:hypothetical protein n=1 Tax=Staphylococcus aureus TaxID=1280 RepID=UPI0020274B7A|nr:hypothetical protein [Staphylococcus aureus]MCL9734222.1 hypothetical protein [Staphylococcus aureus]